MSDLPPPSAHHTGREHCARGPNASAHHLSSPGEEYDSYHPRSPMLLPCWGRLQRTTAKTRRKWWWKTMASGTRPWERGTQPLPTEPCRSQWSLPPGRRGSEGGVKQSAGKPSPGRSQLGFSSVSGSFHFPVSVSPSVEEDGVAG